MLALFVVAAGAAVTLGIHWLTGTPITASVGIMSGAVTNTPGLGAAQQAYFDTVGSSAPDIALGYAVAYPLGVIGCIMSHKDVLQDFSRISLKRPFRCVGKVCLREGG